MINPELSAEATLLIKLAGYVKHPTRESEAISIYVNHPSNVMLHVPKIFVTFLVARTSGKGPATYACNIDEVVKLLEMDDD